MIPDRTQELNALYREIFGKPEAQPKSNGNGHKPTHPTNVNDRELLEIMFASKNGDKYRRLWEGDWSGYPSQSEADQAWANVLAHYTGDENRSDRMFRDSGLMRDKWDEQRGELTYGEKTIKRAFEGRTAFWEPEPSFTITAAASTPDSAAIAELRAENDQLRAEVQRLKEEKQLFLRTLRNPALKGVAMTALAVIFECESVQSRGLDEDGKVLIRRDQIAENAGCSATSVSNHLKKLSEYGVIDRHVSRGVRQRVDQETGEITLEPISELRVELRDAPDALLRKLAEIKPVHSPNWGGRRIRCPQHPDANITITKIYSCSECGIEIDRDYSSRPPDPPNPDEMPESKTCIPGDTPPTVVNVSLHDNSCTPAPDERWEDHRNSSLVGRAGYLFDYCRGCDRLLPNAEAREQGYCMGCAQAGGAS